MTDQDWNADDANAFGPGLRASMDMLGMQELGTDEVHGVGVGRRLDAPNPELQKMNYIRLKNGQELRYQTDDGSFAEPGRNTVVWKEWAPWHGRTGGSREIL